MIRIAALTLPLLVAACGSQPTPAENVERSIEAGEDAAPRAPATAVEIEEVPPPEDARPTDAWVGRWVGVEGMMLDIAARPDGDYDLTMQYTLDDRGTFVGRGEGDLIVFQRDGRTERLRPATGDETGMKWLAGARDCLMVRQHEGYCRDGRR